MVNEDFCLLGYKAIYIYIYIYKYQGKVSEEPPASIFRIVQVFLQYILIYMAPYPGRWISSSAPLRKHQILQKW